MYYLIYPEKDTTLYEKEPTQNTGIDPILEITKWTKDQVSSDGWKWANTYNSRILMQFDLSSISSSITKGEISSNASYHLNLRAIDATDLPVSYSLAAYPLSQSWDNGNGNTNDVPKITNGASWYYRDNTDTATRWQTSSFAADSTGSWVTNAGGGCWYTASAATQSFNYTSPDVRMDVTNIVKQWISGSIPNNGLIIKRPNGDESGSAVFGKLKFFGKDTHTIYVPRLEVAWDDSSFVTGSLSALTDEDIVLYFKNLRPEYKESSKAKLRIVGRSQYPTKVYSTSSVYLSVNYLPTSSYYSVKDSRTEETIIPFDNNYTKLSCDSTGNYFNIRLNAFQPERYYKFIFKVERSGGDDTQIFDNGYYFKVIR